MNLGLIIYIISILGALKSYVSVIAIVFPATLIAVYLFTFVIADGEYRPIDIKRYVKPLGILVIILIAIEILIPSKQEMYAITLTKDYKAEEIYMMTKEELKSGIDYFIESLEKVTKWQKY